MPGRNMKPRKPRITPRVKRLEAQPEYDPWYRWPGLDGQELSPLDPNYRHSMFPDLDPGFSDDYGDDYGSDFNDFF